MRSLLKNSSYLGASRIVAAIASVATLAFTGRALGVMMFGLLILIHSYAQAASSLSKFQSWQIVVRYGGQGLAAGRPEDFKVATGFSFGLDMLSGVFGMIAAMAILPLIGTWFGIPRDYIWLGVLYCTVIPTMQAMTPSGVLRTLDRFDLVSWGGIAYPIARAIFAGIAFLNDAPFEIYLLIWWVTDMGGDLFMWWLTVRELKRRDMSDALRPTLNPHPLQGAWKFAIRVNLTSSLTAAWGPVARLIVGGLLGPASAAFYRVAATLSDSAQKPTDLMARAFYPEVMKLDTRTKRPWKLMLRGAALAAIFGVLSVLLVVVAGEALIKLIFGAQFAPAYPVLIVLVLAPMLAMLSFPFEPMLYSLGRSAGPLKARIGGTIVYFAIVAPLAWQYGVQGAAAAFVIATGIFVTLLAAQLWREYRRIRPA
ncbi:lipopolysaccharide biosynthesis protein [Sphingomonas sabuli]|uniref:Lipopolysaccharide biosynthesis protein n=1 Tax=Sphingomonas sabuli TaxID=2764186 RepID=A0A7G9L361_9SPHN|nr:lipopolysaccharide biosynthesis protein [Sphingomonas sabuli]QNM83060.1 lipopolysaccharide biosynthesis protein [Sphingomonas sabuli]